MQNCRCFRSQWFSKHHRWSALYKSRMCSTELHAVSVCGGLQIVAYCNDWHSCCGAVELGPSVKVLLDLPRHRQLVLVLWHPVILENQGTKLQIFYLLYNNCIFLLSGTCMFSGDSGKKMDLKVINLHWPMGDRAPARLCISDPPLPAASQWSEPKETHDTVSISSVASVGQVTWKM